MSTVNGATIEQGHVKMVQVESSFSRGYVGLHMVGNTAEICRDGRERAKTALEALNIYLPPTRLVINLSPAEVRKDGSQLDLPLALSMALLISGRSTKIQPREWVFAAELGLCGRLRPVRGVISFALEALAQGKRGIVVATESLSELSLLSDLSYVDCHQLEIVGFGHLQQVLDWLYLGSAGRQTDAPIRTIPVKRAENVLPNFNDMILTPQLKQLAVVCAVGAHSLLLRGTPGCGKSMFALRLRSILPKMNSDLHIEALKVASAYLSDIPQDLLSGYPPLRHPHHHASAAAVLGTTENPGEITLAHGGLLFLDEFPEFRRDILEGLREPLENGEIRVSRSKAKAQWKSKFQMIAAANNCPCGWLGSEFKKCRCTTNQLRAYKGKLSGPILDRIDIHFNMPEIPPSENSTIDYLQLEKSDVTEELRQQVRSALDFGYSRNLALGIKNNAAIPPQLMVKASGLEASNFTRLIENSLPPDQSMSRRSLFRLLRVARTVADIEQSTYIEAEHLRKAAQWSADSAAKQRGEHLMGI